MAKPAIKGAIDEMIFRKCCGFQCRENIAISPFVRICYLDFLFFSAKLIIYPISFRPRFSEKCSTSKSEILYKIPKEITIIANGSHPTMLRVVKRTAVERVVMRAIHKKSLTLNM